MPYIATLLPKPLTMLALVTCADNLQVCHSGQVVDAGAPDKVDAIQMLLMFEAGGMTIADIPPPLWMLITKVVLPFARFLGYQAFYPEYF